MMNTITTELWDSQRARMAQMKKAEAEAIRLRQAWVDHPDHTILKAMVAERSIFFVVLPLFRFLGDVGLRTVSADISRDEQIHVATNSLYVVSWVLITLILSTN